MLKVVEVMANDIADIVRAAMSSDTGINVKVGRNTLTDSELFRSIRALASGDVVVELLLNDYVIYVENGRRKGAKCPRLTPSHVGAGEKVCPTTITLYGRYAGLFRGTE